MVLFKKKKGKITLRRLTKRVVNGASIEPVMKQIPKIHLFSHLRKTHVRQRKVCTESVNR